MRPESGSASPASASTPAMRRRRSTPGRGGRAGGQVLPVKGAEGFNRSAPVSGPTHVDAHRGWGQDPPWRAAVDGCRRHFKSETYRFLRSAAPAEDENACRPAGYIHLPRGVDAEWVKQLVAEQLVTVKTRRGFTRLEWQKLRERNEALDCRVYARAAAWIAGADRWPERKWRELEAQVTPDSRNQETAAPEPDADAILPTAGRLARRPAAAAASSAPAT